MTRLLIITLLVAAGCYDTGNTECGNLLCPRDRVCSPDGTQCVLANHVEACANRAEGDGCNASDLAAGFCHAGVCIPPGCGNGVVEVDAGEVCDDGNRVSFDGCSADCMSTERCGDGVVDRALGETCDCGDGAAAAPSGCTGANSMQSGATCRPDCQPSRCGDGVHDPLEWCDDGNQIAGDGCRADCMGRWTSMQSGTLRNLNAVWGTSASDVFAAGNGRILHFDGTSWQAMTIPDPTTVYTELWGNSSTDVYALGNGTANGTHVEHYDGSSWSVVTSLVRANTVWHSLWAYGGEGFVVGIDTTMGQSFFARGSGTSWTVTTVASARFAYISGTSASDIYATSNMPTALYHYNGSSWSVVTAVTGFTDFAAAFGTSPSDWYVSGTVASVPRTLRLSGGTWVQDPGSDEIAVQSIGGVAGDVQAVGGFAVRYDGGRWSVIPGDNAADVWGYAPDHSFIVGANGSIMY